MANQPHRSMSRSLSYSEIFTALTCYARHAFGYTGHLTDGQCLTPRQTAPILSDGRAWGAAVAAFHSSAVDPFDGPLPVPNTVAHAAIGESLRSSEEEMLGRGFEVDLGQLIDQADRLGSILDHYAKLTDPLFGLSRMEDEMDVPIPSRSGSGRASSRYRYQGYIDGHFEDDHPWIVEFKLRGSLTPAELIEKMPQFRFYAWARRQQLHWNGPIGVLVDERLNEAPKPARLVKAKKKDEGVDGITVSHAVDQLTTPDLYEQACFEYKAFVHTDVVEALRARRWQQRVPLVFTPSELDEVGRELVAAAKVVRDLDSGALYPIRNGSVVNCRKCRYTAICSEPSNDFLVDSLFDRAEPKRYRTPSQ